MAKDINLEYLLITVKAIVDEAKKLGTSYDIDDSKVKGEVMAIISALRIHLAKDYEDFIKNHNG